MRETIPAIEALAGSWTAEQFERPYAPGKWTARAVLIHLAQTELALGTRSRMALTRSGFVAHSFDQDAWLAIERQLSGPAALALFCALGRANLALYSSLSMPDREIALTHEEYGHLTVDWIIHQQAGHQVHHLVQLRSL
jgi:hypothetical protein